MSSTYNFGDGHGPVPAHRHPNGDGWVAGTETVTKTISRAVKNAQDYSR